MLADNQLLLGSTSEYRVQSLFTTNSLFDVQFALRMVCCRRCCRRRIRICGVTAPIPHSVLFSRFSGQQQLSLVKRLPPVVLLAHLVVADLVDCQLRSGPSTGLHSSPGLHHMGACVRPTICKTIYRWYRPVHRAHLNVNANFRGPGFDSCGRMLICTNFTHARDR